MFDESEYIGKPQCCSLPFIRLGFSSSYIVNVKAVRQFGESCILSYLKQKHHFFVCRIRLMWGNERLDSVFLILSVTVATVLSLGGASFPQVFKAGILESCHPRAAT